MRQPTLPNRKRPEFHICPAWEVEFVLAGLLAARKAACRTASEPLSQEMKRQFFAAKDRP